MLEWFIVAYLAASITILPLWAWLHLNRRRCPSCGRRRLSHVDRNVFYDPYPNRAFYHCTACGADFVRHSWRWVPRSEWPDPDDQAQWDAITKDE